MKIVSISESSFVFCLHLCSAACSLYRVTASLIPLGYIDFFFCFQKTLFSFQVAFFFPVWPSVFHVSSFPQVILGLSGFESWMEGLRTLPGLSEHGVGPRAECDWLGSPQASVLMWVRFPREELTSRPRGRGLAAIFLESELAGP